MTDWREWHTQHDDSDSDLSQRLSAVQRLVGAELGSGTVRDVLSLCAGAGSIPDVLPTSVR